jgi:hypothetical protein
MNATAGKVARQLHVTPQFGRLGAETAPTGRPQYEELL